MLPEPVKAVRLDATLKRYGNGMIPADLLKEIRGGGRLYGPAADWWNCMWAEAVKDGVRLRSVSAGYRSREAQERLFFERYSPRPTLRRPKVTRVYGGKKYWLKRGKSPSATPGKSSHGYGLSQDVDVRDPKVFAWLCNNAPKFGFYMQAKEKLPNGKPNPEYERWHWQYAELK